MTRTEQDWEFYAGETKIVQAPIYDSAGVLLPTVSGTATWKMAVSAASQTAVLTKVATLNSPSDGYISFTIDANDTENIEPRTYYHECQFIDGSSQVSLLWIGSVTIHASLL